MNARTPPPGKGSTYVNPRAQLTLRAIIVWAAGVLFYILAVTGRTSFGVAGVEAIERFGVDASRIAVFTAMQLGVYSLAQIPTGLLVDRFGARRVLVIGALIMAVGQIILGFTSNYWVAIGARVLIGAGDATAFLSVLRILPYWFPLRWTPLFTQLTAGLGQLGQFLSAVPFFVLLGAQGWTVSFVSLGTVGVLIAIVAGLMVAEAPEDPDTPHETKQPTALPPGALQVDPVPETFGGKLAYVARHPASWQAFFTHYVSMVFQVTFTLLWGVPLMSLGMGLSNAQIAIVLTVNTTVFIASGPITGMISARAGLNRDCFVVFATIFSTSCWAIFLMPTEARGLAAIIAINVIMPMCTTPSNFGFDTVRMLMPRAIVATGTGLGNMGGFLAAMVGAQSIGILLDASSAGEPYKWDDFRLAFVSMFIIWGIGLVGLIGTMIALRRRGKNQGARIVVQK